MPTFGLRPSSSQDEIEETESGMDFIRRWLLPSMSTFKKKRNAKSHRETIILGRQIKKRSEEIQAEVARKFDERKRKHMAQWEATTTAAATKRSQEKLTTPAFDYEAYRRKWVLEADHPSSTATINAEGIISEDIGTKLTISSGLPLSNKTNLFTVKPEVPKQSSLVKQTNLPQFSFIPSPVSTSTSKVDKTETPAKPKPATTSPWENFSPITASFDAKKDFDNLHSLETYDGARPSFATGAIQTSTPLKSVKPIGISVPPPRQIPTIPEAPFSKSDSELIAEAVKVEQHPESPKSGNDGNLCQFYSTELEFADDTDIIRERLEKPEAFPKRSYLIRTLRDRIGVTTKRMISTEEAEKITQFLLALITGNAIEGFNSEQMVELTKDDERRYAAHLIVKEYQSTIQRDASLIDTSAIVLGKLATLNAPFEKLLAGRIMQEKTAIMLRYDIEECSKFASSYLDTSIPAEKKAEMIAKEKAIATLFIKLHVQNAQISASVFQIGNLWRFAALLANATPRILASPILINILLENANSLMSKHYGKQWIKLIRLIKDSLVPTLENLLRNEEMRRKVDEAAFISVLNTTLDKII